MPSIEPTEDDAEMDSHWLTMMVDPSAAVEGVLPPLVLPPPTLVGATLATRVAAAVETAAVPTMAEVATEEEEGEVDMEPLAVMNVAFMGIRNPTSGE